MKDFEVLYKLEEKIEKYYMVLAKLEINEKKDSEEYNSFVKLLNDLINEEKKLLLTLNRNDVLYLIDKLKQENVNTTFPIALGHLNNAYCLRLLNILYLYLGDDLIDYGNVLRYDINQILFSFLNNLIYDDYYKDIKENLVFYKYNQIFLNVNSEYDFLLTNNIHTVNLESNNYRTHDLPSYFYVDKTVLVLESTDFLSYITGVREDFKDLNSSYTLMVISIINVLARLVLCENDILNLVYDDLINLLEDDIIYESIKDLVREMLDVLEIIKNRISWAR